MNNEVRRACLVIELLPAVDPLEPCVFTTMMMMMMTTLCFSCLSVFAAAQVSTPHAQAACVGCCMSSEQRIGN